MLLITFLWSLNAAIALVLAVMCALVWFVDRRDTAKLMFCVLAVGTAAATPFELGMMQAATPAEMAEQLRWYHLPIFFTMVAQTLFVRTYLGTGRLWLLGTFILIRVFVVIANFLVEPNFNFSEISSLQHVEFMGEQVAAIGESTWRPWQALALVSVLLMVTFVIDATVQAWRKGTVEMRRRANTVALAIVVPMIGNLVLNQLVTAGVLHIPIVATLWFLGTLTVISYEFGRELIRNSQARLQLAELRHEWARVERVNSLGYLASALAHELLQPLAAIRTNIDAVKLHLRRPQPDLHELRAIANDIEHDDMRATAIIDRMRTFIRGSAPSMQVFALKDLVQEVFSLLRHEATSRGVELRSAVPASLPAAYGDRVQISQVILNLLINAVDAVQSRPAGSRVVVFEARTGEMETIEITVLDTGPGIPEGRLDEIFNPLYTTKAAGLGVGLALSRMIVEAHGGRIRAQNAESGGAVFRFTLPSARQEAPAPGVERGELAPQRVEADQAGQALG